MRRLGLTMRVVSAVGYDEPRDAISHDWLAWLAAQGIEPPQGNHHRGVQSVQQIALHLQHVRCGGCMLAGIGKNVEARHQKPCQSCSGNPSASTRVL